MAAQSNAAPARWKQFARSLPRIQMSGPFGRLSPRRVYPLALDEIQPVIRIAHQQPSQTLRIPRRIIFDHEFVLIRDGEGEIAFDHRTYPFAAHDLFLIPPFSPHRFDAPSGKPSEHIAVHFDFAPHVPSSSRELSRRSPYEVRFPGGLELPRQTRLLANDRIEREFIELIEARMSGTAWSNLRATACLVRILTALFERASTGKQKGSTEQLRNRARIERVLAYVNQNLARSLPAAELAHIAGVSPSHFNRLFREWTGYSPLDYLRRQRIATARRLLANVDLSIKEVAAQSGFKDPYHFSKAFRQLDGLSPSQFREAALAGKRA